MHCPVSSRKTGISRFLCGSQLQGEQKNEIAPSLLDGTRSRLSRKRCHSAARPQTDLQKSSSADIHVSAIRAQSQKEIRELDWSGIHQVAGAIRSDIR